MEYLIGVILSLAVAGSAAVIGFDRERAFYPTVLIVIASYYVLFAAMGASRRTLIVEIVVAGCFLLVAVLGFKKNFSEGEADRAATEIARFWSGRCSVKSPRRVLCGRLALPLAI
jgi:hypothetical protein